MLCHTAYAVKAHKVPDMFDNVIVNTYVCLYQFGICLHTNRIEYYIYYIHTYTIESKLNGMYIYNYETLTRVCIYMTHQFVPTDETTYPHVIWQDPVISPPPHSCSLLLFAATVDPLPSSPKHNARNQNSRKANNRCQREYFKVSQSLSTSLKGGKG
jgi:hypothetical protein